MRARSWPRGRARSRESPGLLSAEEATVRRWDGRYVSAAVMTSLWTSIQPFARLAPWIVLVSAAAVFPVLFFVPAPYGRHFRPGWGPALSSRLGWVAMEWPSVVLFALLWIANPEFGT